ncbi:MAG: hypothetical protein PHZ14_11035 [Sulfuricella sp.]|nr:hypothetical protein [Sulfuricella sp.]
MIGIKVDGLTSVQQRLLGTTRKVEVSSQRALIKIAGHIRDAEKAEMGRVFDRPTRWTLGAMKVKITSKMEVSVGIIDTEGAYKRAQNYLGTQVSGGSRKLKAMERALQSRGLMPAGTYIVPGVGARIDAFGNIATGEIRQILSWFDAAERWAGSTQNMLQKGRDKRRKGTKKARGFEYVAISGTGRSRHLQPGIYRRTFFGFGSAIKPILIFVRSVNYKPRFDFGGVARKAFNQHARTEFDAAFIREFSGL